MSRCASSTIATRCRPISTASKGRTCLEASTCPANSTPRGAPARSIAPVGSSRTLIASRDRAREGEVRTTEVAFRTTDAAAQIVAVRQGSRDHGVAMLRRRRRPASRQGAGLRPAPARHALAADAGRNAQDEARAALYGFRSPQARSLRATSRGIEPLATNRQRIANAAKRSPGRTSRCERSQAAEFVRPSGRTKRRTLVLGALPPRRQFRVGALTHSRCSEMADPGRTQATLAHADRAGGQLQPTSFNIDPEV